MLLPEAGSITAAVLHVLPFDLTMNEVARFMLVHEAGSVA